MVSTRIVMEQTGQSGVSPGQLSAEQEQQLAGDLTQLDKAELIALVDALRRERKATPGSGTTPSSVPIGNQDPPAESLPPADRPVPRPRFFSLSRDLMVNSVPAVLAVAAGIFFLPNAFERERALARPMLSLEYVFMMRDSHNLSETVRTLAGSLANSDVYNDFFNDALQRGQRPMDLRMTSTLPNTRLGPEMARALTDTVDAFRQYLDRTTAKVADQQRNVERMSTDELRQWAFLNVDGPAPLVDDALRTAVAAQLDRDGQEVESARNGAATLQQALAAGFGGIRMRVSILNKGATDGLVRHTGKIEYRGKKYDLRRSSPPSSDMTIAVPVFQTNQADEGVALQSVGKVESDSMAEFWFEFSPDETPGHDSSTICNARETVHVSLYDHERQLIPGGVLECNQEDI